MHKYRSLLKLLTSLLHNCQVHGSVTSNLQWYRTVNSTECPVGTLTNKHHPYPWQAVNATLNIFAQSVSTAGVCGEPIYARVCVCTLGIYTGLCTRSCTGHAKQRKRTRESTKCSEKRRKLIITNSDCSKRRGTERGRDKRERYRQRVGERAVTVCVFHTDAEGETWLTLQLI